MATLSAAALLEAHRKILAADAERMKRRPAHMPRGAWRDENPIADLQILVRDTAFKTMPVRTLLFDFNGTLGDLLVAGDTRFIDRIDLKAADADDRISRYVPLEQPA